VYTRIAVIERRLIRQNWLHRTERTGQVQFHNEHDRSPNPVLPGCKLEVLPSEPNCSWSWS